MAIRGRRRQSRSPGTIPPPAPYVEVERVTKSFGDFKAVDDVSLKIYQGRDLLPAGRVGMRQDHAAAHAGRFRNAELRAKIFIDGEDMTGVPPYERPVNMMFQSYALFPHMKVEQNVAFGLKQDRVPKARDRTSASRPCWNW